jgi:AcrR family transcriptional regulator
MFSKRMQVQPLRSYNDPAQESAGERSRGDILATAAICFMERGYTETSIDDVARRLGATKGRVYHHFASKADLFAAIFRAGMEMDYAAIEPVRGQSGQAVSRLAAMATAHTRQVIRSKPFQRVVWQGVQLLKMLPLPEYGQVRVHVARARPRRPRWQVPSFPRSH